MWVELVDLGLQVFGLGLWGGVALLGLLCILLSLHVGGCQNYGPFLGTLNITCRSIIRTQKGTLIYLETLRFSIKLQSETPICLNQGIFLKSCLGSYYNLR